jgi:hypothetical protein
LDQSIDLQENAVKSTPIDDFRFTLATTLQLRFKQMESIDDINRAIKLLDDVVKNVSTDDPQRVIRLQCLAQNLGLRFDHTDSMDDLNQAISSLDKAMKITSKHATRRATVLDRMGNAFQRRFSRTG